MTTQDSSASGQEEFDEELIESIAPDVLRSLNDIRFFEKLDDRLCPTAHGVQSDKCRHDFAISRSILTAEHFSDQDVADVLDVLHSRGACCDCEVLYNVSETNRLKASHWKAEARRLEQENKSE